MTNRPVRIAVQVQPQHADFAAMRRAALQVEELGADVLFTWDHFYPLSGDPAGKHFECWTTLGALAEATSRVELGPLVTPVGYRNPDLLADMARTVDHVSDGRLILGLGSGWFEKDYDEYGYEFGTVGSRLDDLAAALPRIEARLGRLNPSPVRTIPVMIGGGGERKTLPLVARHADIWHSFGDPETFSRKSALLDGYCADLGRDPAAVERSVTVSSRSRSASPDDLGEDLLGRGVTLFTIEASGPDYDLSAVAPWIAWRDRRNG